MNERLCPVYNKYAAKFNDIKAEGSALYVVSTPVGNLEDISFRALQILKTVDLIAAEDTRVTGFLLSQYGIRNKIISYYSHVESDKSGYIIDELKNGSSVALVSDAGTPGISDPGNVLVSKCILSGIRVVSIPGCSSLIHSLVMSGFSTGKFFFQGFLPAKKGRKTTLDELSKIRMPIIVFESPYRILKTLKDISDHFGNKEISVSRELTKKFEQTIRGNVKSILNSGIKSKGEFVIIVNNT